jgi:hypothetical protein
MPRPSGLWAATLASVRARLRSIRLCPSGAATALLWAILAAPLAAHAEPALPAGPSQAAPLAAPSAVPADATPPLPGHDPGTTLFTVGADFEIGGRRVGYTDLVIENLRTYDVIGVPVVAVAGEAYPGARSNIPVVRDLGLAVAYAGALGLDSALPDGTSVRTSWHRVDAALRGRIRIGSRPFAPLVTVSAGYAFTRFAVDAPGAVASQAPTVTYHSARLGADGRVPIGPVALRLGAGYRFPFAAGALVERFRDGSVGCLDALVGIAVPITRGVEARASAEYTRYFYSFYPEPGDPYIAGGALDEYLGIKIGAAYVH